MFHILQQYEPNDPVCVSATVNSWFFRSLLLPIQKESETVISHIARTMKPFVPHLEQL